MKSKQFIALLCCTFFAASLMYSQEMTAKKYDDPQWYNIVYIDYLPGKYNKAMNIIDTYFRPATEKGGTNAPKMLIELNSGPYDVMVVWHMKEGLNGMNWEVSPDNIKWRAALNDIAGGVDKAGEILDEYQSCIASSNNTIGRLRL